MSNDTLTHLNTTRRDTLPAWAALHDDAAAMRNTHLNTLFAQDAQRFDHFHCDSNGLLFDYSKQAVTRNTMDKLLALATACDLAGWRDAMFNGEEINTTEGRAVLHTALRSKSNDPKEIEGTNITQDIADVKARMKAFATDINDSNAYTDIVNIGIGGSDLGAAMAYDALKPYTNRDIALHFVSNVDSAHLDEVLGRVNPAKTLFIIVSKTFTTQETMTNAHSARDWLREQLGTDDVSHHFAAVSRNIPLAQDFGINADRIFPIWNWVGGRFSIWSAVGLSLCIALGYDNFAAFLDGAADMDTHFKTAPFAENIPVLHALLGIWNRNFLNHSAVSIIPYSQYLHRFAAYMQQVDMESNGKTVDRNNDKVAYDTGAFIMGEAGTNVQHSYFQHVHQGSTIMPCEFIAVAQAHNTIGDHQQKLLANCLAQSKAMMEGQSHDNPHNVFDGNRPSTTLILKELTPYTLGRLMALYEHKIFVQGVIWNINSFDQCGVELGKTLAKTVISSCQNPDARDGLDSSTQGLLSYLDRYAST